jgi:hypothetical protein
MYDLETWRKPERAKGELIKVLLDEELFCS